MSTSIEWTDERWNPVRGCSRVSPGCGGAKGEGGCYAERQAARFSGPGLPYEGLVRLGKNGPRWTGEVRLIDDALDAPLRWKKPRRVFVNSMSDLFHETLTNEQIAAVFGVMAAAPQHTFQVLTKRATRMREWFAWAEEAAAPHVERATRSASPKTYGMGQMLALHARSLGVETSEGAVKRGRPTWREGWPLPWVWLGVSVEDQQRADERIPELLATPAAVRFVSAEPLLGYVVLSEQWLLGAFEQCEDEDRPTVPGDLDPCAGCPGFGEECGATQGPRLDWVIVGGESGRGARPFDIGWARKIVADCKAARVPVFVKQLGGKPMHYSLGDRGRLLLADRKGGDMYEWPEDLRVREWPEARS